MPNMRALKDIKALKLRFPVEVSDSTNIFFVFIKGPEDTPYADGLWKLSVTLPEDYPYRSPCIGFVNKLLHPNVDFASGSVCLNVLNQHWTPMYDLIHVFEVFIPQLLSFPNPSDPLNSQAARSLMSDKRRYESEVRSAVRMYAMGSSAPTLPKEYRKHVEEAPSTKSKPLDEGCGIGEVELSDISSDID
ncbi:hypothetical protein ADUPG1_014860 [Aduncisulcus paluster]|uniref:UBC core domain-containing protein n=1 Tax=Aduncisulcus paluster TaxID=2918883 RepID=A0ABQ5KBG2_9EUKA|nr:hypothetical protein ADUPG1_014860 [Aduncisulcus paluster]